MRSMRLFIAVDVSAEMAARAGRIIDRLRGAGVEADAISVVGACTSCDSERFFSYRRDGAATGRQAGIVWIGESA